MLCQSECTCLHQTVNMVVFFTKNNENTYPKGRALMQMNGAVPQAKRGNCVVQKWADWEYLMNCISFVTLHLACFVEHSSLYFIPRWVVFCLILTMRLIAFCYFYNGVYLMTTQLIHCKKNNILKVSYTASFHINVV